MTVLDFVVLVLAVIRVRDTWLNQKIAAPLRRRIIQYGGWLAYLAGCSICLSLWISAGLFIVSRMGFVGRAIVVIFGVAQAAIYLDYVIAIWVFSKQRPSEQRNGTRVEHKHWSHT